MNDRIYIVFFAILFFLSVLPVFNIAGTGKATGRLFQDNRENTGQKSEGKTFTINGYVYDGQTTESLIGANVYNHLTSSGTSTNRYGFYSLTLPAGEVSLVYSFVGYEPAQIDFYLKADTVINIRLSGSLYLGEVEITADKTERIQERTQMSSAHVPVAQIKAMPALLGEADVLKTLQLIPGIQSGGEGSSGLHVRGGTPDQNLFLLDGVPLYNVSHLFGFFSTFNADAINHVEVFKGGFPARYGGRVSSVVDISLKEGNMQEFHGEGAIGLISSRFTFEGPVRKEKTSFIVSGRRTYADLLARPILKKINPDYLYGYYFYDLTAKINHRFSDSDRIYLSAYWGDDVFYQDEQEEDTGQSGGNEVYMKDEYYSDMKQGTFTTAFRWNHIFSRKLFSNTTLSYCRYRNIVSKELSSLSRITDGSLITEDRTYYASENQSDIRDWSLKTAFDYLPAPAHHIRFGFQATHHAFSSGIAAATDDSTRLNLNADSYKNQEYGVYMEDDIRLGHRLGMNIGLRWSGYATDGTFYQSLQPRVSLRYLITGNLSLKASYSRMTQHVHLLANSNLGLQTDLWVPSTPAMKPQHSHQYAVGLAQNFREEYEVSLEAYYKTMNNVMEFREGVFFSDINDRWEEKVVQGEGRSYGGEVFIQKKTGSLTGWIGYALSWTDRQFDEINGGRRFPYKYDRRHDLSLTMVKRLGKKVELSASWVFTSGACTNVPVSIYRMVTPMENAAMPHSSGYYVNELVGFDYGERNSYRMNAYHRLDLGVSLIKREKWGERRWIFGLYNAYCRSNPYYIDIKEKAKYIEYEFIQYSLLPVIPSVSYQFRF